MLKYIHKYQNLSLSLKIPFDDIPILQKKIEDIEKDLRGNGRLVLRYSGTENKIRIMIEGSHYPKIVSYVQDLSDIISKHL